MAPVEGLILEERYQPPPPPKPANEAERLISLRELGLVGGPTHPALQDLSVLAAYICEAPMALVTLVEDQYQWFGAKVGVEHLCGTPREHAFCAHTIMQDDLFVVQDTLRDERFARNPLVTAPPYLRFYAGMPIITPEGYALGSLCVIDYVVRGLTPKQELGLRVLGRQAATQLEFVRSLERLRRAEQGLHIANARLERGVAERTVELEAAQTRMQLAIGAAKVGWWEWNMKTDVLYHSPESCAQFGYRESEMPKNWAEWEKLMHPEDLARASAAFYRYLEDRSQDYECEMRVRHADGTQRWILTRARIYPGGRDQDDRFFGCHLDISERKAMEETLRQSREQLRGLAEHLHLAREQESGRIARELHDELGSMLTGLKLDVAWLDRQVTRMHPAGDGEPLRDRLKLISEHIDGTIGSVRKVCRDLRPAVLDELGLGPALDWLANEFETRTGLPCTVSRPETITMEPVQTTALFRIAQELLTNVARHAQAHTASVEMSRPDGAWILEVIDDGRGLPVDALTRRDRFGLMGLRERVLAAGGHAEFGAGPEGGTRVRVTLPVVEVPPR